MADKKVKEASKLAAISEERKLCYLFSCCINLCNYVTKNISSH